ncbi:short-chain dehydrogenase [Niastella koreensis]|uniref:3-oxoacyl-(Acyl-carrier-protein) reductase n=2 Tax=Niastella koreensis TaxID=354356 RepID=G8TKX8_NIAKG|nr:SDR family oxidoreductase [Niastella koreensis]AEW00817.1 3-oxoacyl-(acyl-carrier-protein) reductase [Niastella koreensis GR20-10]OQP42432.1 short-chain dehydrogenase [Niastella koreensis]
MNLSLEGKNAVICGSSQGIGLAIAAELALLGANCTLMARNEETLQAAVKTLDIALRQQHGYLVADFTNTENVKQAIRQHVQHTPVHILVNNTGGPAPGSVLTATEEAFTQAFKQHLIVNQILAQAVVPSMKEAGYGRIINIISTSIRIPITGLAVSGTVRGAVAVWSKILANEVGQFNITVNNILPGSTKTQRLESLIQNTAQKRGVSREVVEHEMQQDIPMKRFGEASELGAVAAFLASPAASYVNGVSIPVDGGKTGAL